MVPERNARRRRPVTFSFMRRPEGPLARFIEFVRYGRELGFHRLWVPDQTYYADPFALIPTVVAAVPHLEFGVAVTNPYTRHPVQIARAAATVAEVCGGRFLLGLGAGNRRDLMRRLDIDGSQAAPRVRDAALVIRRLLRGDTVEHEGFWALRGVRLECEVPVDISILIGTRNPQMLRVAGEVADGVLLESLVTPAAQQYGLERIRRGAAATGRQLDGFEVVAWQRVVITDRRDRAVEMLRPWVAHLLGVTTDQTARQMGIRPDALAQVRRAFVEAGPEAAAALIGEEEVRRFVIVGDVEEVAERCETLIQGGATDLTVQVRPEDPDGGRETLRRFAEEVRPRLRW